MIVHAKGHTNHAPSDLNFEANLRSYKADFGVPQVPKPFKYPSQIDKFNSTGMFKG
jgi:hypothetical protein